MVKITIAYFYVIINTNRTLRSSEEAKKNILKITSIIYNSKFFHIDFVEVRKYFTKAN